MSRNRTGCFFELRAPWHGRGGGNSESLTLRSPSAPCSMVRGREQGEHLTPAYFLPALLPAPLALLMVEEGRQRHLLLPN